MPVEALNESGKLFLLVALLAKDRIVSNNCKVFLKEMVLKKDRRLMASLNKFETKDSMDSSFLEEIHNLIMEESQEMYNSLFFDTSLEVGKSLSKQARDTQNLTHDKSLIYGEVDYASFYRVLRKINPLPGLVFYDLGSGTSKAVFAARLTQDFSKCVGIEILSSLHQQARIVVDRYNTSYRHLLAAGQNQQATVYLNSFLEVDWSDGDVVFANSTCFDDSLMQSMATAAESLKPGSIFVTFTKGLPSQEFELLERKRYRMSWGPATVFIQRRKQLNSNSNNSKNNKLPPYRLNVFPSDEIEYQEEDNISINNDISNNSSTGNNNKVSLLSSSSAVPSAAAYMPKQTTAIAESSFNRTGGSYGSGNSSGGVYKKSYSRDDLYTATGGGSGIDNTLASVMSSATFSMLDGGDEDKDNDSESDDNNEKEDEDSMRAAMAHTTSTHHQHQHSASSITPAYAYKQQYQPPQSLRKILQSQQKQQQQSQSYQRPTTAPSTNRNAAASGINSKQQIMSASKVGGSKSKNGATGEGAAVSKLGNNIINRNINSSGSNYTTSYNQLQQQQHQQQQPSYSDSSLLDRKRSPRPVL